MTKKAVISIDLASFTGTLKFVPGQQLPRHDKRVLEQTIATTFLTQLCQREGTTFDDVRSNSTDPPDVVFKYNGQFRGLELSELVPDNRLEKDAIIRKLRRNIISELDLGDHTKGFVVNIFIADDYSAKLRPGNIHSLLARILNGYFQRGDSAAELIEVPHQLQHVVTRISVFRQELAEDPRLEDDREPMIVFGAQSTMLIPEDDCPKIIESRLSRKGLHDLEYPTWLVLWTNHHSLASLRDELNNAIDSYLRRRPLNYERIFHLHQFDGSGAKEFLNQSPSKGSGN